MEDNLIIASLFGANRHGQPYEYSDVPTTDVSKEEVTLGVVPHEKCEVFGEDTVEDLLEGLDIQNGGGNTPEPQPEPTPEPEPMDEATFVVGEFYTDTINGASTKAYRCEVTSTLNTLTWEEIPDYAPNTTAGQSTCKLRVTYEMEDTNKGNVSLPVGTYNCTVIRILLESEYAYSLTSDEFITPMGSKGLIAITSGNYANVDVDFVAAWNSKTAAQVHPGPSIGG